MTTVLSVAEEIIDEQTRSEPFQGRVESTLTCRVLLHAVTAGGVTACGRSADQVAPIAQRWDAAYLPHLPRCPACLTAAPPVSVDIRTAHGTDEEAAGAAALREVLDAHDLRRWMFTDLVLVDDSIRGGFSHPLTINPAVLVVSPARALTTFLHEQLHWLECPGIDDATTEASKRWPDPPAPPAGGHDAESTWLHLSICALEYQSLSEVIGADVAAGELGRQKYYSWIYQQILDDPGWFASFLDRHGIQMPDQIPVPRRYCGEEWWTNLA